MRVAGFLLLLLFCAVADAAMAQEPASDKDMQRVLAALPGLWIFDVAFMEEYFGRAQQLQKAWCGVSWPDSESKKRVEAMREKVAKSGNRPVSTLLSRH